MKQGWKILKLENCFEKVIYPAKIQRKDFLDTGKYPIISQEKEFINGYWNNSADLFRIIKPVVIFGDHTQTLKYIDFDFVLGADGIKILQPNKEIETKYLYYFLQSLNIRSLGYARHYRLLKEFNIYYPDNRNEQHRIVSILDKAFVAIDKAKAKAEQNLKNAKELFESYLTNIFENKGDDWDENSLDELGTITSSKRIYKSEYVNDGIPFYRIKEIKELANNKEISLELFISRKRYNEIKENFGVPQKNDLLMTAVGTIGEIMVVENQNEFYFKDGNILWFKDFKTLDANYLKFALTAYVEKIKKLAIGSAYNALTIEKLIKYRISYPKSLNEQRTLVKKLITILTETKKIETIYIKKLEYLEELKKSILQRAFSGEL